MQTDRPTPLNSSHQKKNHDLQQDYLAPQPYVRATIPVARRHTAHIEVHTT